MWGKEELIDRRRPQDLQEDQCRPVGRRLPAPAQRREAVYRPTLLEPVACPEREKHRLRSATMRSGGVFGILMKEIGFVRKAAPVAIKRELHRVSKVRKKTIAEVKLCRAERRKGKRSSPQHRGGKRRRANQRWPRTFISGLPKKEKKVLLPFQSRGVDARVSKIAGEEPRDLFS